MVDWPATRLGCHLRVKHGFAFQGEHFRDRGDYIVLTPGNFVEAGGFKDKSGVEKYYTATPPADYVLQRGDLIVAMTEQSQGLLGSSAMIPVNNVYLHNQRIGLVELTSDDVDLDFLYHLFNTPPVRNQIQATATGSKVRHTAPKRIEDVVVPLPPLSTQRKIAAILRSYDDLVENNNRRIKNLEEMAQRVYREWFVDFRYPGHEGVPLVKSDLGPIPTGWTVCPLSCITETVTRGVSPKYSEQSQRYVINQKCIRDGRLNLALGRCHQTAVPIAKVVQQGDILVNSTGVGTLGRVAQVLFEPSDLTVDSHVTIVRPAPETVTADFLGLAMLAREADLAAMGVGSTGQTELNRRVLAGLPLVVAPRQLQERFAAVVGPLRVLAVTLGTSTANLRATRDLLLPRLVSGEIDVTDFDAAMPEIAA